MSYEGSKLSDVRLPSTVPLKNTANTFSNKLVLPGAIINPGSTNLITDSDGALATYPINLNVTDAPGTIPGFTNAIAFGNNVFTGFARYAIKRYTLVVGRTYTFSVFVQMDDGGGPTPGAPGSGLADFSLVLHNSAISNATNWTRTQISGSLYRVSVTHVATSTNDNVAVYKYSGQSARSFKITGFQLELRSSATDYIKTDSLIATRNEIEITGLLKAPNGIVFTTPNPGSAVLSRASAATIDGVDYAANTPRYINSGILVEEATTNLLTNTDGNIGTYSALNAVNATVPITGFSNSIQFTGGAVSKYAYKSFLSVVGVVYTFSCYIQMDDDGVPVPSNSSASGDFCFVGHGDVVVGNLTPILVSGSVYRVTATYTAARAATAQGIVKYSTQSSRNFKVAGYQLEQKAYLSSYAESGATAFTRSPDVLTVPATNWAKGSWAVGLNLTRITSGFETTSSTPVFFYLMLSAGTNVYYLGFVKSTQNLTIGNVSGGTQYNLTTSKQILNNVPYRIAVTGNGSTMKVAVDGVIVGTLNYVEPAGALPATISIGGAGATYAVPVEVPGIYRNVNIVGRALTDAELIELSIGPQIQIDGEWTLNNQLLATNKTLTLASDPTSDMHAVTKQYVDSKLAPVFVTNETPSGTINGTNRVFSLANTPIANSVELTQNGLMLLPTTHFTVSGSTLTYTLGFQPASGDVHRVSYRY